MRKQQTNTVQGKRQRKLLSDIALLAFAVLLISSGPSHLLTTPVAAQTPTQYVLLKLAPQAIETPQLALDDHALSDWEPLRVPGWVRVTVARDHDRTIAALRDHPAVQIVEEDHPVRLALTPNDTHWHLQWGPQIVRAPSAWSVGVGSPAVIVAVLDTGIDRHHVDLAEQLWVNASEIPDNNQDDDQNGYVDDVHGWNVFNGGSNAIDDDHGHGTHVSGIIAARGDNGQGIAGMAWGSRIMVVKVLDEYGDGFYSDVAAGLTYATDNGAQVVNLSLGGPAPSQLLQDAVNYAHDRGTLVVAATGNTISAVQYPAACDNVLAVASSTRYDERASYSCYGPEVDLTAPGTNVVSTCIGDRYCDKSGTSMAAPHVSGLAALVYAQQPTLTPDQAAQLLEKTAQDIDDPGWDPNTGWGRIDARQVLVEMGQLRLYYFPVLQVAQ
jgi:subtilisin family serine protease